MKIFTEMSQVTPITIKKPNRTNENDNTAPFSPPADASFDFAG